MLVVDSNRAVVECNNLVLEFDTAGINLDDEALPSLVRGIMMSSGVIGYERTIRKYETTGNVEQKEHRVIEDRSWRRKLNRWAYIVTVLGSECTTMHVSCEAGHDCSEPYIWV